MGSHCHGTNHQDIEGVERVVFLGDSITVGTPPALPNEWYRNILANALAERFDLGFGAAEPLWAVANPISGQSGIRQAQDFWSCAQWGGRNDDLLQDGTQLEDCFPEDTRELKTLVIITSGGNDLQQLARDAVDGMPLSQAWEAAAEVVAQKREALDWLTDPERFPEGNYVVFGNIYEFTDLTGDVESCDLSELAGFEEPVPSPLSLFLVVAWIEQEYAKMAVETGTDMLFMLEEFCGHGYNHDDPDNACYRGRPTELWFDLTCIHPNVTGHQALADYFLAVIEE
jgi:lysophospholipase L1-like esterase